MTNITGTAGAYILGTAGFVLYFIYDVNSVKWKNRLLQKLFAAGSLCVLAATVWMLMLTMKDNVSGSKTAWIGFGALSGVFLFLLIYTLFFALPFEQTYLAESREREAYTGGVYSLCRHPGVLWFAGLYLCLWGVSGDLRQGLFSVLMILWNLCYIIFQDQWTFPKTFSNYQEYKNSTPFLLPTVESSRRCWQGVKTRADKK